MIPQREAEPCIPAISVNQVTMWAAVRRLGTRAVGPYPALIDPALLPGRAAPGPVLSDAPGEKQQKGWT